MEFEIKNAQQTHVSDLAILILRSAGGEFYAKELKGRPGQFRVLGTIDSGNVIQPGMDDEIVSTDVSGLTVNVVVSEAFVKTLREQKLNAFLMTGQFSANVSYDEEGEYDANVWAEPVGKVTMAPTVRRVTNKSELSQRVDAAKMSRAAFLATRAASDAHAKAKAETPDLVPSAE